MFLAPLMLVVSVIVTNPEPAATSESSPAVQASPGPHPSATPKTELKEIGHVTAVTAFCKAFVTHFNTSAQLMTADDSQISYVDFVLGKLKKDFQATDRDNRLHDDRLDLIAYVKHLQEQMPKLQEAINQLRRAGELTIDPQKAKEAREVAAQLQKSLDKEKQITTDTLGVIHAMLEQASGSDVRLTNLASPEVGAAFPAPSGAAMPTRNPDAMDDIRSYLEMDRQRDRIGDAESEAMNRAEVVLQNC